MKQLSRRLGPSPTIDVQRLARSVRGPDIDTRTWVSAGTVGYYDDGEFRTTPLVQPPGGGPKVPSAVYVDTNGMVADVRLEPSGDVVPCRYDGIAVGMFGAMLVPLRGGEDVLVAIAAGQLNALDLQIVAVRGCATRPVPSDWNNDRVLFDLSVPLEIRGPAVRITSGNLVLNGRPVRPAGRGI